MAAPTRGDRARIMQKHRRRVQTVAPMDVAVDKELLKSAARLERARNKRRNPHAERQRKKRATAQAKKLQSLLKSLAQ